MKSIISEGLQSRPFQLPLAIMCAVETPLENFQVRMCTFRVYSPNS